ncbi:Tat pathway signal sequence domain protein [Micromonospora cathayae]|uniref:Tat pathway signal sequence domain protein n=1 Tax=Micromonospora cathayae TaxID=3028804 RepID=A0ABY7ZK29_9ACTN|nr:Tat pathway signal sequence domain protein [Micromonospora sp. HUAS 3]WDZ83305.1 Tat pathway signal sequence domain protein [Micromonospora sp. HUAS 3]
MRRYVYLAVTTVTALLTVLATGGPAAAAGNVLTYGSTGGTAVGVGQTLNAGLKTGTTANLYNSATGTTGVRCAQSTFGATVTGNPTAPGTATESLGTQTVSSCTSNVVGVIGVRGITVNNLPYVTSVTSGKVVTITGGAAGPIETTATLSTLLGTITCVYRANGNKLVGTANNADTSITLVNQPFTKVSGPGTCFTTGYFSVTYAPVTGPGGAVYVN